MSSRFRETGDRCYRSATYLGIRYDLVIAVMLLPGNKECAAMLVLSRRRNQVIQIGENIRVTVVNIRRSSVKLAIEAPREVPVHRTEVRARIDAEMRDGQAGIPHDAATLGEVC